MRSALNLATLAHEAGLKNPSIVVRSLADPPGADEGHAAGEPIYPASMIKVPLAVACTRWMEEPGGPGPAAELTVGSGDMTPSDPPSPLAPGERRTLGELIDLMLTRSDNVATNVLIEALGRPRIAQLLAPLGLPATAVRRKLSGADPLIDDPGATGRNAHPAADAARLFEAIARRSIPRAAWIEEILARQFWNDRLSGGLQPGDRFAHKTGETDDVNHDGGILRTAAGATFVIVVYTSLGPSDDPGRRFAQFMRELRPRIE